MKMRRGGGAISPHSFKCIKGVFRLKKRKRIYVLLALPAMALMLLFIAAPLANAIRISFFRWNGYSQTMRWNGLENYIDMFSDDRFWRSVLNTLIYGFGSTLLQNVSGLAAALFLNKKFKGRNAVRVILYMPIMISGFIMGQILYFFIQADGGVFNEILTALGLSDVYWMETGLSSTIVITLANSWQYMGLCMLIYLANKLSHKLDKDAAKKELGTQVCAACPMASSCHTAGACETGQSNPVTEPDSKEVKENG